MKEQGNNQPLLAPELMARVRQIQLRTRQLMTGVLQGSYRSNFRGTGIEFEEVRPYQPGDEVRSIDWNVTARTGEPHIKTFIEERQLVLQLVVDTSRSMDFGSGEKTKREVAAELSALLAFVAAAEQDQIGLALYASDTRLHIPAGTGHRHALRVVREVVAASADGTGSSLSAVLEEQLRHLKRRSLMIVVSDFLGLESDDWTDIMSRAARQHDVICVRISDPFEEELPPAGVFLMQDVESGAEVEIDARSRVVREDWRKEAQRRRAVLLRGLSRAGVDLIEISCAGDVAEPVVRCFQKRARVGRTARLVGKGGRR